MMETVGAGNTTKLMTDIESHPSDACMWKVYWPVCVSAVLWIMYGNSLAQTEMRTVRASLS